MEKQLKSLKHKLTAQKTETLLQRRENLQSIIEDATILLSSINDELYVRASKADGRLTVGERTVTIVKRLSFSQVPLEIAKKFRAVKKVVDPSVLKPLYDKGVKIEGATYTEYVQVR